MLMRYCSEQNALLACRLSALVRLTRQTDDLPGDHHPFKCCNGSASG
jgi:hypothetical protein